MVVGLGDLTSSPGLCVWKHLLSSKAQLLTLEKTGQLQSEHDHAPTPWQSQSHLLLPGLQRWRGKVGSPAPNHTSHNHHEARAHTDGYHWHMASHPAVTYSHRQCSVTLAQIPTWAHKTPPGTELLLLRALGDNPHHIMERGFGHLWVASHCLLLPLQVSFWLSLCSPALPSANGVRPEGKTCQASAAASQWASRSEGWRAPGCSETTPAETRSLRSQFPK